MAFRYKDYGIFTAFFRAVLPSKTHRSHEKPLQDDSGTYFRSILGSDTAGRQLVGPFRMVPEMLGNAGKTENAVKMPEFEGKNGISQ